MLLMDRIEAGSMPAAGVRPPRFLAIEAHVVDVDALRVTTNPGVPRLTPKSLAVLLRLANAGGRTLSRDALLNDVWKGTCPTPDVVTQAITDLRRAFGDDAHAPRYIETLPRVGYRLIATVRFADSMTQAAAAPSAASRWLPRGRWLRAMSLALVVLSLALSAAALIGLRSVHAPVDAPCDSRGGRCMAIDTAQPRGIVRDDRT